VIENGWPCTSVLLGIKTCGLNFNRHSLPDLLVVRLSATNASSQIRIMIASPGSCLSLRCSALVWVRIAAAGNAATVAPMFAVRSSRGGSALVKDFLRVSKSRASYFPPSHLAPPPHMWFPCFDTLAEHSTLTVYSLAWPSEGFFHGGGHQWNIYKNFSRGGQKWWNLFFPPRN